MAYSNFTLDTLKRQFHLQFRGQDGVFAVCPPRPVSAWLQETLRRLGPLGLLVNTEKARSEFVVAPILGEVREQLDCRVSVFSGVDFSVNPSDGLSGACDFLIGLSDQQFEPEAPAAVVVEAKNENLRRGAMQCVAELVAVQQYNAAYDRPLPVLYGAVTTGSVWQFLQRAGTEVRLDTRQHYLDPIEQVVGILVSALEAAGAHRRIVPADSA